MTIEEIEILADIYGQNCKEFAISDAIFNIKSNVENAEKSGIARRDAVLARDKLIEAIKQYKGQK